MTSIIIFAILTAGIFIACLIAVAYERPWASLGLWLATMACLFATCYAAVNYDSRQHDQLVRQCQADSGQLVDDACFRAGSVLWSK